MSRFRPAIVRVAVRNNFNCTPAEWKQMDEFRAKYHPVKLFFVNSNINTPRLPTINEHPFKAVITANPGLRVNIDRAMQVLAKVNPANVAFVRVKWVPGISDVPTLIDTLLYEWYTVVVTMQRFSRKDTLLRFADPKDYEFSCTRFRLVGKALQDLCKFVDCRKNCFICDRSGKGCLDCGQCSTLVTGESMPIRSLNLSTSGECPYNCPDCYAKAMYEFHDACKTPRISYDKIYANRKQSGKTKHIEEARREAA